MKVINIRELLLKSRKKCFDIYTLDQFIEYGDVFGLSSLTINLEPFIVDDDWLAGWYVAFVNKETDRYCVIAQDGATSEVDFVLLHKPIKEWLSIIMGAGIEQIIINTSGKHENNAVNLDELDVKYIFNH